MWNKIKWENSTEHPQKKRKNYVKSCWWRVDAYFLWKVSLKCQYLLKKLFCLRNNLLVRLPWDGGGETFQIFKKFFLFKINEFFYEPLIFKYDRRIIRNYLQCFIIRYSFFLLFQSIVALSVSLADCFEVHLIIIIFGQIINKKGLFIKISKL